MAPRPVTSVFPLQPCKRVSGSHSVCVPSSERGADQGAPCASNAPVERDSASGRRMAPTSRADSRRPEGIPVPIDSMDAWQRMCDELCEEDQVLPVADVALTSGIRRKPPDAWAVHWAVGSCTYWNSHAQMIRLMTGGLGQTHTRLNGTPSTSSQLDDSHSTGCLLQLMNRSFALATSPVAATSTVATYIPESRRASQRDSLRDIYGFDLSSPSVPHHEFEIQL